MQVRSGFAASPTKVRVGVVLFFSYCKFAVVYFENGTVGVNHVFLNCPDCVVLLVDALLRGIKLERRR